MWIGNLHVDVAGERYSNVVFGCCGLWVNEKSLLTNIVDVGYSIDEWYCEVPTITVCCMILTETLNDVCMAFRSDVDDGVKLRDGSSGVVDEGTASDGSSCGGDHGLSVGSWKIVSMLVKHPSCSIGV